MPNSTLQQPVHRNWQPNEPVQPNRAVSGRDSQLPPASQENSHGTRNLSVEYMRRTQSQTANLCYVPTSNRPQAADFTALKENLSDFDTQQATTSDSHVYGDELASMSFQNLLALADGGNEAAIQNVISEKNFVAEGRKKLEFGAPSSSLCGPHENSGPWGPGELPRQTLNEEPGFASLGIGKFLSRHACVFRKEAQNKAEKSRPPLLVDQSPSATSTQLEENHKPDKGGTKEADLTKTPQQKAKRKKHRPKVVIEDHKKRIPNSVKKPTAPQESTDAKRANTSKKAPTSTGTLTGKRKYERIGVTKTESDVDKESTKMAELKTSRITRSSCRRTLDFNSDSRARGESSLKYPSSKWDGETRADNLDTQDGSKTLQFGQETTKKDVVASPSGCWDPQRQARGLKRQNVNEHVESEISDRIKTGKCSDFMQAYLPIFSQNTNNDNAPPGMHFLVIYKKKRTEKGNSTGFSSKQRDIVNLPRISPANDAIQTGRKAYEDLLALLPIERIRKKRSKSSTRRRDLASLMDICRQLPASTKQAKATRMKQKIAILHEPSTCMEALVADTPTVLKTKKRTKRSMLANPMLQNSYNHQKSATMQMGPPLSLTWRITSPVDLIMEQLRQLNLNVTSQTSEEKWNPYMGCHSHNQEQRGLVPFQRSDDLIPFDGTFDDVRRKQPRPKVKLNGETTKVWKLLLDNIQREGIDGTDEEKEKWWDEERRLFSGRTASFIMRTRLVLADRSFSRWKGSVVDSVVGVFLTQNVSDNLSSSAFISLAARFPLKSKTEPAELYEEKRGTEDHCELDHDWAFGLNNGISTKSVNGDRLQVFHGDRIIEVYNVNSDGFFLKDELGAQSPNASKRDVGVSRETDENMSMSLIEDGRVAEDLICSSTPEISSQNSSNSPTDQTTERIDSGLPSTSQEESKACAEPSGFESSTSFVKLLQMAGTVLHGNCEESGEKLTSDVNHRQCESGDLTLDLLNEAHLDNPMHPAETISPSTKCTLCKENSHFFKSSTNKNLYLGDISELSSESASGTAFHKIRDVHSQAQRNLTNIANHCSNANNSNNPEHTEINTNKNDFEHCGKTVEGPKVKGKRPSKETEARVDWDELRKQAHSGGKERARIANTMDSVDWEAVRCADVNEIAQTIKDRGMSNMLGERIKDFLNRLVRDHGSIDLEWLRDVPPDKAKEYLLSIRGLGLKSVECVRLLELRHDAFPVDTNVARIAVRLGWVPLQPLPESLQLHLLEMYPVLDSIQKYLWPRLCKLDQGALYELHYLMITFGKVFCTKSKPNCKECPMKGECRHFASACASARLSLPAPDGKSIVSATENTSADQNPMRTMHTLQLPSPEASQMNARFRASNSQPIIEEPPSPEPIIEVPETPEQVYAQVPLCDIENHFNEDPDEIPTIELNMEEFTLNLQKIIEQNADGNMSKALVALSSTTASIPVPKLKNVNRLRTEHQVYELPDSHPLLEGMDKREPDDPCPYLLAIWTPGETVNSIEPPQRRCSSKEFDKLCRDDACSSCNSIREEESQTVRGTFLIPCRTAMRGSFPLNGTYFQVNEVFSDHESSLSPMAVPREWLWNLRKRTVYFGTSIPTIFKGMTIEDIQHCFWRGYVCVRGFDRKTRAPRPLIAKLHFPASRLSKGKVKMNEN